MAEPPSSTHAPTLAAAHVRIAAVRPAAYARTRNALNGAVSGLSPYINHGMVSLSEVLTGVLAGAASPDDLPVQHKFVYELGWHAYFRHVWQHRGDGILQALHDGPLPDAAYRRTVPDDIRQACTGVPVIDQAVRTLYTTGLLHNHARMWLASYMVHLRKVHWRSGADWLHSHLLDGDLASNHLSWQWVAGTGSRKPYLFNAENVARYAPPHWHSPGTVVDAPYEQLDRLARQWPGPADAQARPGRCGPAGQGGLQTSLLADETTALLEPEVRTAPPAELGFTASDARLVAGRDVWLVHPWCLGPLPGGLAADTLVLGLAVADHHRAWPWCSARWQFVGQRMAAITPHRWHADGAAIGAALAGARRVRCVHEPHLATWLPRWADGLAPPALFPPVPQRCDSFFQWWSRATRSLHNAADLLAVHEVPAW